MAFKLWCGFTNQMERVTSVTRKIQVRSLSVLTILCQYCFNSTYRTLFCLYLILLMSCKQYAGFLLLRSVYCEASFAIMKKNVGED